MYYHYGDWVQPPEVPRENSSLCSAFSFLKDLKNYAEMASFVGNINE